MGCVNPSCCSGVLVAESAEAVVSVSLVGRVRADERWVPPRCLWCQVERLVWSPGQGSLDQTAFVRDPALGAEDTRDCRLRREDAIALKPAPALLGAISATTIATSRHPSP